MLGHLKRISHKTSHKYKFVYGYKEAYERLVALLNREYPDGGTKYVPDPSGEYIETQLKFTDFELGYLQGLLELGLKDIPPGTRANKALEATETRMDPYQRVIEIMKGNEKLARESSERFARYSNGEYIAGEDKMGESVLLIIGFIFGAIFAYCMLGSI